MCKSCSFATQLSELHFVRYILSTSSIGIGPSWKSWKDGKERNISQTSNTNQEFKPLINQARPVTVDVNLSLELVCNGREEKDLTMHCRLSINYI